MLKKPEKTKQPDSRDHAYNYALFLLGLSMRTEAEMRQKMQGRGYLAVIVDEVVAQLYEEKLLDDKNYAEVYLKNLKQYRSFGYFGIKKKLMEKKLPQEIIEQVLEEGLDAIDELSIGKKLICKELGNHYKKNDLAREQKQKLARKLQARGFRSEVLSKLLF